MTSDEARDESAGQPIRVLLVDDDALVRAGLRMILSAAADMAVVAEAADGAAAVRAVASHDPHVVLMDIRMPVLDGIAATAAVATGAAAPAVIVLTTFDGDEFVLRALRAGASGFLLKDTAPQQILDAVRLVRRGEAMLSPSVTRTVLGHMGDGAADERQTAARARLAELTAREHEVALAIGRGASNSDIASSLFMSEATVKAHVSRLLTKLGSANRVQVAIMVHDAQL